MISADSCRRAAEEDKRWKTKAILRIISTVFAVIALGLFSASVHYTNTNWTNTEGPGDWTDGLALAPAVLALIYNSTDLVLTYLVRRGRPLHPALHAGLDLIVWVLLISSIIVAVAGGIFWYWTEAMKEADGSVNCAFFFNEFSPECSPIAYTIGQMEIAGLVFEFGMFIIHLALFVLAITDLHRKRVAASLGLREFESGKELETGSFSQRS